MRRLSQGFALILATVILAGCGPHKVYTQAEKDMRRERFDQAVLGYSKAVALDPGNTRYSVALERAKLRSSAVHFEKGKRFATSAQYELAIAEFQQTLLLAPGHQHARQEMQRAIRDYERILIGPSQLELLKESARKKELAPPRLDPRSNIPILLNFQQAETGKIFEAISKASGINFIYDEKVDLDRSMDIDIGNVSLEKALDILMLQTKNFYKVIDEYTLLIAPDTRQKRQEYEDQVIRTFFLSNADTKTVVTLLRSLLQSRQIAENPDLNSVTIKDTPAKVAIAERIINANDKSKGEVLIDVELLEINRTTAATLGIDLSSKALSLTFRDGAASVPLNNLDVLRQTGNWTIGVIPSVLLNFLKSDSDSKLIAKPQLRVAEGERAEILIGDRVPIPTTSFNTSQTVGGNIVPITSFTYQNVGITVQIEPRVHHNKEVTLQVQVEISQVTGTVETGGGQAQPIIGTRQIQTVIRLRDGETNMLAGLIQQTNTDAKSGVAGVTDVPGLGRLFSTNSRQSQSTDIIMTITPHIIRIPDITEEDLVTLWVGTEDHMELRGPARSALSAGPFGASATPSAVPAPKVVPEGGAAAAGGAQGAEQPGAAVPEEKPAEVRPKPAEETKKVSQKSLEDKLSVVQLVPGATSYSVGDTVEIQVHVSGANNVGSIPFHLHYNKEVLQFMPPGTEGSFMNSDGANTVFLAGDTGNGGKIVVGLSRMGGGEGISGAGSLATFRFLATNAGSANFSFTGASVKDPQANNKPAAFNTAAVKIDP